MYCNIRDPEVNPFILSRFIGIEDDQIIKKLLNEYDPQQLYYNIDILTTNVKEGRKLYDLRYNVLVHKERLKSRKKEYYESKKKIKIYEHRGKILNEYDELVSNPPKFQKEPPPIPISIGNKYIFPTTTCKETSTLIKKKESKLLNHIKICRICQTVYEDYQKWYKNIIKDNEVLRKHDTEYQHQRIEFICNREELIKHRVNTIKTYKHDKNVHPIIDFSAELEKDFNEIDVYAEKIYNGLEKIIEYVEKKYSTTKIIVKIEYENFPLALASNPHETITIKDIFHLLKYNIELDEGQKEWEKHKNEQKLS